MSSFVQAQWPSWAYNEIAADPFSAYSQVPNSYPAYLAESMEAYQAHHSRLINQQMSRATESKPRLSKEEVEVLEAEFQKNHKPNSNTKKALAESMHVDNARINNWFQNRRAREKKEKNIREYEARQKMEKEQSGGDASHPTEDRKRDLVGSSAPFPEPRKVSMSEASAVSSPDSTTDASEAAEDTVAVSSSIETTPDLLSEASNFMKVDPDRAGHDDDSARHSSEDIPDYLSISDANGDNVALSDSEMYPDSMFGDYQGLVSQSGVSKANQFFSSQLFLGGQGQFQGLSPVDSDISVSPISQIAGSTLKSPPPIDIASRRNRHPTPISTQVVRHCSSNVPKSAMDFGRRNGDMASFMRRTSSASGSGRISKSVGTPRNMISINRSPSTGGKSSNASNAAPPTPNTPIAAGGQQLSKDMPAPSAFPLGGKFRSTSVIAHDPTLTTPPTTPGIMDGLFQMNAAYGLSVGDESLINMGMGGIGSGFDMGGMAQNSQTFMAGAGNSQQDAMFISPMSTGYIGLYSSQSEFNWSDSDGLQS